ncbi:mbre TPR repeat protein [Achlya hypogyna]|uniref:Mbre TPR repeat protein n=1 Tax=Achlya hypogyna TaxID=1202772 RepID=A0A1V9Z347_ACHHY|nr:mbre TPR repeat protein [Achlya hypogyna]
MATDGEVPLGVKLGYFTEFISAHGGPAAFTGLTTGDVCTTFLLPMTAATKTSLVEQLTGTTAVQPARWFVSHAWKYLFLDVVESLTSFFATKPADECVVWFDLFCNSQHDTSVKPFSWWTSIFRSSIGAIQNVVMVLLPWDRPIPLTRAWCVFEVFSAVSTNSSFHVAMTQAETNRFADQVSVSAFYDMLGHVKSAACEAFKLEDKAAICTAIEQTVGFIEMDNMVFRVFERWMDHTLSKRIAASTGLDQATWQLKLASLFHVQGKYVEAEALFDAGIATRITLAGTDDLRTIEASDLLASLHKDMGKFAEAEQRLRTCIAAYERLGQGESPSALVVLDKLATTLQGLGKYSEAEAMYTQVIAKRAVVLGPTHQSLFVSKSNLAGLLEEQGKYDAATPLHQECLAASVATVGQDNPNTLTLKNNLARNLHLRRELAAAEVLYTECLADSERVLGEDHPGTLATLNNVAANYCYQRKYAAGETIYRTVIERSKRVLGPEHPSTLLSMNNLASVLKDTKKYEAAGVLFQECIALSDKVLGASHPSSLTTTFNLARMYEQLGKVDDALKLMLQCLTLRRQVLPPDHPSLLNTIRGVAMLYESKKDLAAAEPLLLEYVEIQTCSRGPHHPDTIMGRFALAEHRARTDHDEAEALFLSCVESAVLTFGPQASETSSLTGAVQVLYLNRSIKSFNAKEWGEVAHHIAALEDFGLKHPLSPETLEKLTALKQHLPVGNPRRVVSTLG